MPSKGPESIGRYQVVKELKSGGMGTVFLGRDPRIGKHMGGRFVAIKVLQEFDDQELRARFEREADIAGTLDHRNIVQIYDNGEFDGRPFIVMEYVDGQTMRELIETRDVPLVRRLEWMEALCDGMSCAHRAGVVHRDIKPDNIIIRTQDGVLKILDFGIARANTIKANMTRGLLGTLNYMAPEQWEATASVDSRADMFAAGAVFYELLTGRKAFPGADVPSIYQKIAMLAPEPLEKLQPNLDPDLIAVVNRCLEKRPADRYADMDAVRGELAAIRQRLASRDAVVTVVRPARTFINAAQRALETGEFELALQVCAKALESEPNNTAAREIEGRARMAIQLQGWISGARDAYGRGALTEAGQFIDQVLGVDDKHPEGLTIRQEIDTARRQIARSAQIDVARARAREALDRDELDAARAALAELVEIDRGNADLPALNARLGAALARRQAAEAEQRARQVVAAAQAQFRAGQHEAALGMLQAHQPAHAAVTALLGELLAEYQEIERRRIADQRARRTIDEAGRRIKAGDRAGALAFLESHQPAHPDVTAALVALRGQIDDLERQQSEARGKIELERKRLEAERTAEEERRRVDEERQRKADQDRRRADDERRRKAEEEQRRADDERRRKAEEDRRRADDERRRKAEEEQRRRQAEEDKRRREQEQVRIQPGARGQADPDRTIVTLPGPATTAKGFDWRVPAAGAALVAMIGLGAFVKFRTGPGGDGSAAVSEPARPPDTPTQASPGTSPPAATPVQTAPGEQPVDSSKLAAVQPGPTNPQPAATAAPTVTPPIPAPAGPSASAAVDRQVANLISTAQQQWARNDRNGAMTSLASASKLRPGDADSVRLTREFIREISERASNAATAARSAGASDVAGSPFADARRRQQAAAQLERTGKPDETVRAYDDAIALFARALATVRPATVGGPAPPPAAPPAGTTATSGGAVNSTASASRATPPPPEPVASIPAAPVATLTPATPAAPPPAANPPSPSPPTPTTTVVNDDAAIRQTLQRYRAAYEGRDAGAAKAVNPGIDVRKLTDTFKQYTALKYDIQINRVDVAPDGQSASVTGTVTSQPTARTGTIKATTSNAVFRLRKSSDGWLIQDVTFK